MLPDSAFNVVVYKKIDQASRLAGFLMVNSISLALFVITKMFVPAYQSLQNTPVALVLISIITFHMEVDLSPRIGRGCSSVPRCCFVGVP